MQTEDFISTDEFCAYHKIEFSFIRNLEDFGLIEVKTFGEGRYIHEDQLEKLERILRLHHDLEINVEGIDTITHLLQKINSMQQEINKLKNRLRIYEEGEDLFL
ncbi:chaperone modulator CbpM [Daejeonella oryzae]|uniref:chaperone modulator CbpM n=1 Tax=Daejeonella oryzae TaxID=1122943 RepID=UPI00042378D3|nr:chaperone modulator CbpM [Daejeonella oryzae]